MINPELIFNGHNMSQEIPGFCLLGISGREGQTRQVSTITIPGRRGTQFKSAACQAKTIKVDYFIEEAVNRKKSDRYNALQGILAQEEGKLIFTDEPDKYWIATVSAISADSITFYCADPVKYSVIERPALMKSTGKAFQKTFELVNEGTVPVPVRYEITIFGESGYVGLAGENGAMEFGSRTEANKVYQKRDERSMSWSDFKDGYDRDSHHAIRHVSVKQEAGEKKNLDWIEMGFGGGRGDHPAKGWCYATKTYPVRQTSQKKDVMDFELQGQAWFECGVANQIGEQIIEMVGMKDGKEFQICQLTITKGSFDLAAWVYIYVNGVVKERFAFTPNNQSPFAQGTRGYFTLSKTGDTVSVRPAGGQKTITAKVSGIESVPLKYVRIRFGHQPMGFDNMVTRMYFRGLTLTAKNVAGLYDVRNTFFPDARGMKLTIDGETSKFYCNGAYRPELEIVGTSWFLLPPGSHTVRVIFSDWYNAKAEGVAYIREAWL